MLTKLTGTYARKVTTWLMMGSLSLSTFSGCSRQFWRRQAEKDTYNAVTEKLNDPRWQVPRIDLKPDVRSRFFDPYDPDCEPLPPDDPAAHEFMHCVNGKRGYKSWHKLGTALSIENPQWLEPYGVAVQGADPVIGHSQIQILKVTLPDAVDLAYIHSRDYQTNIEDLYLDALALTLERFRLGVRFINTAGAAPGAGFSLTNPDPGRSNAAFRPAFGISQALPAGGQIAVELVNQTVWLFGSKDSSASSMAFTLTQPLLLNAGRKIALEPLTQAERNVLYQARTLARFRQTLFTSVAQSYLGLLQQKQNILNTENNLRQLREQLDAQEAQDSRKPNLLPEMLPQMPDDFEIPESLQGNLRYDGRTLTWTGEMTDAQEQELLALTDNEAYQAAVQQIIAYKQGNVVSLSAAQLRTNYNSTQNQLENSRRQYADQLDNLKITLGLPPNVQLEIDETLLAPFELISLKLIQAEKEFRELQLSLGQKLLPPADTGAAVDVEILKDYLSELALDRDHLFEVGLTQVQNDFEPIRQILQATETDWQQTEDGRRYFISEGERERVMADLERDLRLFRMSEREFAIASATLDSFLEVANADSAQSILQKLDADNNGTVEPSEMPSAWQYLKQANKSDSVSMDADKLMQFIRKAAFALREDLQRAAQSLQVVQAGLRVEAIALNRFALTSGEPKPDIEEVVRIGLEQRHDLMNARASVMDRRRAVEIAANRLESTMDLRLSAKTGAGGESSNYQGGIDFKTPMDMVDERNAYNVALINYQRERRAYMLLEDQIKQSIRQAWRQITVQEKRIEVDRQTVRNAALQYDNASLSAQGAAQTNALNLLNALNSVLGAQNSLVSDWVTYENNRLNVFRDMGIMEIDRRGVWTDGFYQKMDGVQSEGSPDFSSVPPIPNP
ncbi:MAG: TolC family protein [Planctomycetaceae bacterium]|nr:TolC family protein [Planctomycetaceae bacterium]